MATWPILDTLDKTKHIHQQGLLNRDKVRSSRKVGFSGRVNAQELEPQPLANRLKNQKSRKHPKTKWPMTIGVVSSYRPTKTPSNIHHNSTKNHPTYLGDFPKVMIEHPTILPTTKGCSKKTQLDSTRQNCEHISAIL